MMKKLFSTLLISATLALSGQVMDTTVTDCNNNSRSIYATLATGKALVVASKGFDCSICKNKAPGWQSWTSQNKSQVEVWGAMTFLYSGNTPTCNDANSWVSTYSWNDIFTFLDLNKKWFTGGTPYYYVYDPSDNSIAYQGNSDAQARSTALSVSQVTIGLGEAIQKPFSVSGGEGFVSLDNLPHTTTKIQIVALTGKVIKTVNILSPQSVEKVDLSNYTAGIYLVNVQNKNGFQAVRKVYLR